MDEGLPYNPHSLVQDVSEMFVCMLNRIEPQENFHFLNPPLRYPQSKMSLKCLAAQSIRKYNLDYQGQVTNDNRR